MKTIKRYYSKQFLVFALKWQLGIVVLWPMITVLELLNMPMWKTLIISNAMGALIFYPIDRFIFKKIKK